MLADNRCRRLSNCRNFESRSLRIFCNLSRRALEDFSCLGMQVRLPKGAILFQEDDPRRQH